MLTYQIHMKKSITLFLGILISTLAFAGELSKLQVKEAEIFAADAKAAFNLSDADTEKAKNIRLESMKAYRDGPGNLRKAGKVDEAKALGQKINKKYMGKFQAITGCKPKEYWALVNSAKDKAKKKG
jgi:hypothetical protein